MSKHRRSIFRPAPVLMWRTEGKHRPEPTTVRRLSLALILTGAAR